MYIIHPASFLLFIYVGCAGSSLLHGIFSSCGHWGLLSSCGVQASLWGGFSCGVQALECTSFSSCRTWASQTLETGSTVVAQGLTCSKAYGIFLDQGSNPCLFHWQADSLPLNHQGIPAFSILESYIIKNNIKNQPN